MEYIFIAAAVILYLLRFFMKQKKEQEEAARRRGQVPPAKPFSTATPRTENDIPTSGNQPPPKTIDEILKEMHRRMETQSKPYAKPANAVKPAAKTLTKKEPPKPQPRAPEKKEPAPFLSEELSAYTIEGARTPSNMAEDFIKKGELTDIYNEPQRRKKFLPKFNLQDAVIASVVLERPEW